MGSNMAITSLRLFCVLLALHISSPYVDGERIGSKAKTLHLRQRHIEDNGERGFRVLRSKDGTLTPVEGRSERLVRDVDSASTANDMLPTVNLAHLYDHDKHQDQHSELFVHWAGEGSDVIVALARTQGSQETSSDPANLYFSYNYGVNFTHKPLNLHNENPSMMDMFYHSPADNRRYILTDIIHSEMWITKDDGKTFTNVVLQFKPSILSMHQLDADVVLAMDEEDSSKKLWKSENFGESWTIMQYDVKTFFWGVEPYDKPDTLYVERQEPNGVSTIIVSEDYFDVETFDEEIITGVLDFELQKEFLFATMKNDAGKGLDLYVSHGRDKFAKAEFPNNLEALDFYIADATEDQLFVCINHDSSATHLYISEAYGIRYSLSLENVVYYSPEGPGKDSWINYDYPFADLHPVAGLRGIYIASQFNSSTEFQPENMVSLITFDKGGLWEPLIPPAYDSNGNLINCGNEKCSLHVTQKFSQLYPQSVTVPILSKESAPGFVMATGVVGTNLKADPDVFLSTTGGASWTEVLKGKYFYAFGDHGSLIVAVKMYDGTDEIQYSYNEGVSFQSYKFLNGTDKIRVFGLMTEPGEETGVFTVFGSLTTDEHAWSIIQINLTNIFGGVQCGDLDYKEWSPGDERPGSHCLLGRQTTYERRIPNHFCFNGRNYDRPISVSNCSCDREDYECDFGYMERDDWSGVCVLDKNDNETVDVHQIPDPCPQGTFYLRSQGYRRVEGDSCEGSGELIDRWEPDTVPCPIKEMPEFLLFAKRNEIRRYTLGDGKQEVLPITELEDVISVDFDYQKNCVYWSDISTDVIQRLCLDGTEGQEMLVQEELDNVEGIAFDWVSSNLYWLNSGSVNKTIEVARSDGTYRKTLLSSANNDPLDQPRGLALDPAKGYMYWTDWGAKPFIARSYMNGSHVEFIVDTNIHWPNGIAIDDQTDRIYWTEAFYHRLEWAYLDGSGREVLISEGIHHPFSVAVYKNLIYWDDWLTDSIMVADKYDGSGMQTVISNLEGVMGLKVFHLTSQYGDNPCSSSNYGGCSNLCLVVPNDTRVCGCPDGMDKLVLSGGGEQCQCQGDEQLNPETGECFPNGNANCTDDQFRCFNGNCIPQRWNCDHDDDCHDLSDEVNCPYSQCDEEKEFRCTSLGRCIPLSWKCDQDNDCHDWSDEQNCVYEDCNSDQFQCVADGRCIDSSWTCDLDFDCVDNSDEVNCTHPITTDSPSTCSSEQFTCDSKRCIPSNWNCDGDNDCGDNSDEQDCHVPCPSYDFTCDNQQCIISSWLCDGQNDCEDNSDEKGCPVSTMPPSTTFRVPGSCASYQFTCENGNCVSSWWRCDGVDDCGDTSDEYDCGGGFATTTARPPSYCMFWEMACQNGECLPSWFRCDGASDCSDGSDERDCPTTQQPTTTVTSCSSSQFECLNSNCIPLSWVCDGDNDCGDHSDEQMCDSTTTHGFFYPTTTPYCDLSTHYKCRPPDTKCIPNFMVCDRFYDCVGADDEEEELCPDSGMTSPWAVPCPDGKFKCDNGELCVLESARCNSHIDCPDLSDEMGCPTLDPNYVPREVDAVALNSTCILLSWFTSDITEAHYNYEIDLSSNGLLFRTIIATLQESKKYICNLNPGTEYQISIHLSHPDSTFPSVTIYAKTQDTYPSPPQNVTVTLYEGSSIICVNWQPPVYTGGPIKNYELHYFEMVDDLKVPGSYRVELVDGKTTQFNIKNTECNKRYGIQIAANTETFTGKFSETKKIITGDDATLLPPPSKANIEISFQNATSFHISWKSPSDQITGFKIYYLSEHGNEQFKNTSLTELTVTGLLPVTYYLVSISSLAENCESERSAAISVITTGTAIPIPQNLVVVNTTGDSVSLRWEPDSCTTCDGDLEYCLAYGQDKNFLSCSVYFINQTKYTVTGLTSGWTYFFEVANYYFDGFMPVIGQHSNLATGSTKKMYFTKPPQLLSRSYYSVDLEWEDLFQISTYTIHQLISTSSAKAERLATQKSDSCSSHTCQTTIIDLLPCVIYQFYVTTDSTRPASPTASYKTLCTDEPGSFYVREVSLSSNSELAVMLSWDTPENYDTSLGYAIFQSQEALTNNTSLEKVCKAELIPLKFNITHNSYLMEHLNKSMVYCFSVAANPYPQYYGAFSHIESWTCQSCDQKLQPTSQPSTGEKESNTSLVAIIIPVVVVIGILLALVVILTIKHRRLQNSFTEFATSHYDTRTGTATFSGDLTEEDSPMIRGFSDDEPLVIA